MLKFCPEMTRNTRLQNILLRLDETSLEQNRVAKNTGVTLCAPNYQSLFNQYLSTCPQNITSSQRPALCSLHLSPLRLSHYYRWKCVLSSDHSAPPPCATQACLVTIGSYLMFDRVYFTCVLREYCMKRWLHWFLLFFFKYSESQFLIQNPFIRGFAESL